MAVEAHDVVVNATEAAHQGLEHLAEEMEDVVVNVTAAAHQGALSIINQSGRIAGLQRQNTMHTRGARHAFVLSKQKLAVERLDCIAVSLFGPDNGKWCLRLARSPCFNVFTILLTLLSTVHFIIGGVQIASFSTFFQATFGQDLLSYVESNGTFVPSPEHDIAEVELRFASINAFLEPWGYCGALLFVLQLWMILVIFITLNIPAASKSYKSFNAVFQIYNLIRWSRRAAVECELFLSQAVILLAHLRCAAFRLVFRL